MNVLSQRACSLLRVILVILVGLLVPSEGVFAGCETLTLLKDAIETEQQKLAGLTRDLAAGERRVRILETLLKSVRQTDLESEDDYLEAKRLLAIQLEDARGALDAAKKKHEVAARLVAGLTAALVGWTWSGYCPTIPDLFSLFHSLAAPAPPLPVILRQLPRVEGIVPDTWMRP